MSILSMRAKATAQELLDWDLLRVAALAQQGHDVTVYQARQQTAQQAVLAGLPTESWPRTVRDVLQALLEVSMTRLRVMQHDVGRLDKLPPKMDPAALRVLATELGVLDVLREVAPRHWGEEVAK